MTIEEWLVPKYTGLRDDGTYLRRCLDCQATSSIVTAGLPPVTHKKDCVVVEALASVEGEVKAERQVFIEALQRLYSIHGCSDCGHGWPCETRRTITETLEQFGEAP